MTETSPVISVNTLDDNEPESVGLILNGVQVRIGPDDELLVKGESLMRGYWNNPEASAQVLSPDGWLHTGDQARMTDGHLYITGRIKDILVLSNGEKVPPADMEMAIIMDPLFEQALVIGEGRAYLSALLVLDSERWSALAAERGLDPDHPASLDDPQLHRDLLQRVRAALRDFPGFAKIRRVIPLREPWSIDNGLLTPTLKLKRGLILSHHRAAIERLYANDAELA